MKATRWFCFGSILLFFVPVWAQRGPYGSSPGMQAGRYGNTSVDSLPTQPLDTREKDSLLSLREEEKLARDVYLKLYEKWRVPVFDRIANSEQRHMDMIRSLLDRYGLADPVRESAVGVFKEDRYASLFQELVRKGVSSYKEALTVGATIEDRDIHDLNGAMEITDNADLKTVYDRLRSGSYNHIRAFSGQLKAQGAAYEAQYMRPEELRSILSDAPPGSPGMGRRGRVGSRAL